MFPPSLFQFETGMTASSITINVINKVFSEVFKNVCFFFMMTLHELASVDKLAWIVPQPENLNHFSSNLSI